MEDLRQQSRHCRLAGARVADEHEVAALVDDRQLAFTSQVLDPDEVGQQPHLGLHRRQADETVQLGQQLVERAGGRRPAVLERLRLADTARHVGRSFDLRRRQAPQHHRPERVDGEEAFAGRHLVEGRARVRDAERGLVVAPAVARPVPAVGADDGLEQRRRRDRPRPVLTDGVAATQLLRCRAAQGVEPR